MNAPTRPKYVAVFMMAVTVFMTLVAVYAGKRCLAENRRANEWRAVAEQQAVEILNFRIAQKMAAIRLLSETNQPSTKAP